MKIKINEIKENANAENGYNTNRISVTIYPDKADDLSSTNDRKENTSKEDLISKISYEFRNNEIALDKWNKFLERNKYVVNNLSGDKLQMFILMALGDMTIGIEEEKTEYVKKYNECSRAQSLIKRVGCRYFMN